VEQRTLTADPGAVSDRAAQAAARVAARFSKAPSYSEMQAAEARAALRTAEAATRAALEAQAAAHAALANLTATEERIEQAEEYPAQEGVPELTPEPWESGSVRASFSQDAGRSWEIRWDPDLPGRAGVTASTGVQSQPADAHQAVVAVEPAQPIHANLIHFPRELVATRRLRPRLANAQAGEVSEQLSIFEVDPSTISIDPMASTADLAEPAASWCGSGWSSIHLGEQPRKEPEVQHDPAPSAAPAVHLAPLELRLMAAAIDIALIVCLVCAAVAGVAGQMHAMPTIRFAEAGALGSLILTGVLYQVFFLLTMRSTPGMMYAGIALCTFDDEHPTRAQLRHRLGALLVSTLPVGLGMAWAIFDEDHLSWHDRLSRTYQRKC
jgi:uncharacterized RDD family membrane protein YckC